MQITFDEYKRMCIELNQILHTSTQVDPLLCHVNPDLSLKILVMAAHNVRDDDPIDDFYKKKFIRLKGGESIVFSSGEVETEETVSISEISKCILNELSKRSLTTSEIVSFLIGHFGCDDVSIKKKIKREVHRFVPGLFRQRGIEIKEDVNGRWFI